MPKLSTTDLLKRLRATSTYARTLVHELTAPSGTPSPPPDASENDATSGPATSPTVSDETEATNLLDWIQAPYRITEAPRVMLHILAQHPATPPDTAWFIRRWLDGYNDVLSQWMTDRYGENVFPYTTCITQAIMASTQKAIRDAATESMERAVQ